MEDSNKSNSKLEENQKKIENHYEFESYEDNNFYSISSSNNVVKKTS